MNHPRERLLCGDPQNLRARSPYEISFETAGIETPSKANGELNQDSSND
jgi:hypothetical protein